MTCKTMFYLHSIWVLLAFLMLSCSMLPGAGRVGGKRSEPNFSTIFHQTIQELQPVVPYKIQTNSSGIDSESWAAIFATSKQTSFQAITLKLHVPSSCKTDTQLDKINLKAIAMGPGGSGFELSFCGGTYSFTLTDSNRLSAGEQEHGLELIAIAKLIQQKLQKIADSK